MLKSVVEVVKHLGINAKAYVRGQDTLHAGIQYIFTLTEGELKETRDGKNARFVFSLLDENGREVQLRTCKILNADGLFSKYFSEQMETLFFQVFPDGDKKVKTFEFYADAICNKNSKHAYFGHDVKCYLEPQSFKNDAGDDITWYLVRFGDMPIAAPESVTDQEESAEVAAIAALAE